MAVLEQDVLVGRLQCVVLGLQRGLLQEEVLVRGQERGVLGLELVEPRLHRARHLPLPGVGQAVLLRQGRGRLAALLERAVLGLELLRALRVELVREEQPVLGGLAGELQVGESVGLRG